MNNQTVRIIDWGTADEDGQFNLEELFAKCEAKMTDWCEKDYGVILFVSVPEVNRKDLYDAVCELKDYHWEG